MPPVKRESSPSPRPYDRKPEPGKKAPKGKNKPTLEKSDGRTRLVQLVIERGIASVMGTNMATTQGETGLTAKQIQNYLGKGRSLRARLEEVAKSV
ncbi:hypothetical protein CspeluHIS016_0901850 [Cutaneotrichosporon spelunceum]|uniref:Uncharacterized protein n=1 Tax=Cutaneotrichosporon spelunceum TaxID=1672016 RepID=A0AAD3TZW7_9TREE|nr:hypothetical protein CspeluHIS016_0901850 [Cutaneotrichosporon spelunceum]